MSAENTETLTFVSLKVCFWGFVHCHNKLFFNYLWSLSINSQVLVLIRLRVDEERTPVHTLFNYDRFKAEFLFMLKCMHLK